MRRIATALPLSLVSLLLLAGPALAAEGNDNGEGLVGETDDKIITFFSLGVVLFFTLVVIFGTVIQNALEKRKDARKRGAPAQPHRLVASPASQPFHTPLREPREHARRRGFPPTRRTDAAPAPPSPGAAFSLQAMSDQVRYERVGAAAVLTIDRPERRNAVDGPDGRAADRRLPAVRGRRRAPARWS